MSYVLRFIRRSGDVKVGFVVAGRRRRDRRARPSLRLLPAGHQLTGQLAMMLVMWAHFHLADLLFGGERRLKTMVGLPRRSPVERS